MGFILTSADMKRMVVTNILPSKTVFGQSGRAPDTGVVKGVGTQSLLSKESLA